VSGFLRFGRRHRALSAASCLVLAATVAALVLDGSHALAQERAAEQTRTATEPAGNVERGKKLFVSAGCQLCHNGEAQGGGPGPRLAPNPNMLAFKVFAQRVRQPVNAMPPYTAKVLSDQQLADIYAFLQTVPKPPDVSTIPLLK
jgi:mono/diheme cytochrome c family protein